MPAFLVLLKQVFNRFLGYGMIWQMEANMDEQFSLSKTILELIHLVFEWIGEDFDTGGGPGGAAMGVLVVACCIAMHFRIRVLQWIAFFIMLPICLSVIMTKAEVGLHEAVSELFILGGIMSAIIYSFLAFITGKYWEIKKHLIGGAVLVGVGIVIGIL